MKKTTLAQMKANQKGVVFEIAAGMGLQNKLMSMGVYKGREIVKISHVGLRGPVAIKVGRSVLVLGHGVASKIEVEVHD